MENEQKVCLMIFFRPLPSLWNFLLSRRDIAYENSWSN